MELGNKIRMLRLRAGLTQEMLAEEMGGKLPDHIQMGE